MPILRALRSLRRAPVYAGAIVLTLALGLACVGTMFALVHGVLFAPLPYGEPERLVNFQLELRDGGQISQSPAVLDTYRRHATRLREVALYRTGSANVWTQGEDAAAENLSVAWISASLLPLLQAPPLLGRGFTAEEERRDGPDAVILSETEWRTRYAADPLVLGRTLVVNDVPRQIVGVMPARFAFPGATTRLWLPAKVAEGTTAGDFFYSGLARLESDATVTAAQRELAAVLPRMAERFPQLQSGGSTAAWLAESRAAPRLQSLLATLTGSTAATLWLLAALAGLILLVVWANVASLALIRAEAGRHEVAVREALGANPLRAYEHLFAEAALLGAVAAALALLGTAAALAALRQFAPTGLPRIAELALGPWTAGIIALGAVASALLLALLMSRLDRPSNLSYRLHDGARGQTSGRSRQRLRATVSVLQIAAALVVLAGAALLLRTVQRLHDVHPGFDPEQVTTFRILLPMARYPDAARVAFHARLTERVQGLPSVLAAGLTARLPLGPGAAPRQPFRVEAQPGTKTLMVDTIGNGYFAALRIPLIAGRDFGRLETQRPGELVISRRAAALLFADAAATDVVGRTLRLDPSGPSYTIVGVVGDVHSEDLAAPPAPTVYRPQVVAAEPATEPGPLPAMVLAVRSNAPQQSLVDAIRAIVRELDPGVPVFAIDPLSDVVDRSMARPTLTLAAMSAAAAVALLLGMIGLYGVMAYLVAVRRGEFGLRLALGADPGRLVWSVVLRGLRLASIGVAVGLALFALGVPYLRASVPGIATWEPLTLAGAILVLLGTALLACWIPARRAGAVDPALALRAE